MIYERRGTVPTDGAPRWGAEDDGTRNIPTDGAPRWGAVR